MLLGETKLIIKPLIENVTVNATYFESKRFLFTHNINQNIHTFVCFFIDDLPKLIILNAVFVKFDISVSNLTFLNSRQILMSIQQNWNKFLKI